MIANRPFIRCLYTTKSLKKPFETMSWLRHKQENRGIGSIPNIKCAMRNFWCKLLPKMCNVRSSKYICNVKFFETNISFIKVIVSLHAFLQHVASFVYKRIALVTNSTFERFFPSWTDKTCLFKLLFPEHL